MKYSSRYESIRYHLTGYSGSAFQFTSESSIILVVFLIISEKLGVWCVHTTVLSLATILYKDKYTVRVTNEAAVTNTFFR